MSDPAVTITFLCTGNICRSPMAEGVLRDSLHPRLLSRCRVNSAGVAAVEGLRASEHSVTACAEIGVDISEHRSQPLTPALMDESDLILGLELHHVFAARELNPQNAQKVHLLSAFSRQHPEATDGVPDPIGGPLEEYEEVLQEIRKHLALSLPRLEELIESRLVES